MVEALCDDTNPLRTPHAFRELTAPAAAPDARRSAQWWPYFTGRNASPVWALFGGQLRTAVLCGPCGATQRAFDPFHDLQLPIAPAPAGGATPLASCLAEYVKAERLSGDGAYYCAPCRTHTSCTKTTGLWALPPVLVLQLKRFTSSGWRRSKVDARIAFPVTGLDLAPYCMSPQPKGASGALYNLVAVSCHSGDLAYGHYYACVVWAAWRKVGWGARVCSEGGVRGAGRPPRPAALPRLRLSPPSLATRATARRGAGTSSTTPAWRRRTLSVSPPAAPRPTSCTMSARRRPPWRPPSRPEWLRARCRRVC